MIAIDAAVIGWPVYLNRGIGRHAGRAGLRSTRQVKPSGKPQGHGRDRESNRLVRDCSYHYLVVFHHLHKAVVHIDLVHVNAPLKICQEKLEVRLDSSSANAVRRQNCANKVLTYHGKSSSLISPINSAPAGVWLEMGQTPHSEVVRLAINRAQGKLSFDAL